MGRKKRMKEVIIKNPPSPCYGGGYLQRGPLQAALQPSLPPLLRSSALLLLPLPRAYIALPSLPPFLPPVGPAV